jgi:hypothetical protein
LAYSESLTVDDDEFSAAYAVMDDPDDVSDSIYGRTYGAQGFVRAGSDESVR